MMAIPDEVLHRLLACQKLADQFHGGADSPLLTGPRLVYCSKNDMERREWVRDLPQWRITMWLHRRVGDAVRSGTLVDSISLGLRVALPDAKYYSDGPSWIDTIEWGCSE